MIEVSLTLVLKEGDNLNTAMHAQKVGYGKTIDKRKDYVYLFANTNDSDVHREILLHL